MLTGVSLLACEFAPGAVSSWATVVIEESGGLSASALRDAYLSLRTSSALTPRNARERTSMPCVATEPGDATANDMPAPRAARRVARACERRLFRSYDPTGPPISLQT